MKLPDRDMFYYKEKNGKNALILRFDSHLQGAGCLQNWLFQPKKADLPQ
jgi:hypothetical protein